MNKFILILSLLVSSSAFSSTLTTINGYQFKLNKGQTNALPDTQLGTIALKGSLLSMKCQYSFAVNGGAAGVQNLKDELGQACIIPHKAVVRDVLVDVITAPTSSGPATLAIGTTGATTELKAAIAYSSYSALMAGTPVGTAATAIRYSAGNRIPFVTVGGAALTAGKFNVHIQYQLSE